MLFAFYSEKSLIVKSPDSTRRSVVSVYEQEISRKAELLSGAVDTTSGEQQQESMTTQELMQYGRDKIVATDESLLVGLKTHTCFMKMLLVL